MGLSFDDSGWERYQVALAGWNAAHETDKPKAEPDLDRLRRFTEAHATVQ